MKINTRRNRKPLIIGLIVTGLIVLAAAGYLFFIQSKKTDEAAGKQTNVVDYGPPTEEQEKAGEAATNSASDPNNVGSDRPSSPPPQTNGKNLVGVTITSPSDQSGSATLQIRASITAITSSGTCTLRLTKGTTTVTKQVGVQALPSSATCKGFDIPASELSTGTWNASLTFENEASTGTATQMVTVR